MRKYVTTTMPRRSDAPAEYLEYESELAKQMGRRIRDRRRQLGFKQITVRERMETNSVYTTRAQFSRIERGVLLPNAAEVIALASALDVSYEWLLGTPNK